MRTCEKKRVKGRLHSLETFGTHEGPGIRLVVFLQGCPARCLYCHNPDTWARNTGRITEVREIYARLQRCLPYIAASGGGITVSGGEPLAQPGFLEELFTLCKDNGVHTAVDTAGFIKGQDSRALGRVIGLTDLFIVDLKASDDELYRRVSSRGMDEAIDFIRLVDSREKDIWLRYVLVPGLNDAEGHIRRLSKIVRGVKHCKRFEFLPYHTLGSHKWRHMGLEYPLKGARPAAEADIKRAEALFAPGQ